MSGRYHDRPDVTGTSRKGLVPDGGEVQDTSDATTRDRVWDAVIDLATSRPMGFKLWRVRERAWLDKSKDRTIRRTLNAMAELGWLTHEPEKKWWNLGPKLQNRLEHTIAEDVDPLEVIDNRIGYLEDYTPRDRAHEESLENRKAELEIVRNRMTSDEPVMMTDGGTSDSDRDPDECEGCGVEGPGPIGSGIGGEPLRAIKMKAGGREMLCVGCFVKAVEEGRVDESDPRVEPDRLITGTPGAPGQDANPDGWIHRPDGGNGRDSDTDSEQEVNR